MKPLFSLAAVATLLFGTSSAHAAIVFSGGTGGAPVVVTVTEDIYIPINVATPGNYSVSIVLENVYSTPPGDFVINPQTVYGAPGSIALEHDPAGVGPTVPANQYNSFGVLPAAFGDISNVDFVMYLYFPGPQDIGVGDQLVLRAGSVTLNSTVPLPNNPVTTLFAAGDWSTSISGPIPVPEPSAALLGFAGAALLISRRARK